MDLRQLRYFLTIADARSFTAAAKTLMVTQPTLTMSMKKLESSLGTPLFYQGSQGIQLTSSGQLLYDEGSRIIDEFIILEQRIRGREEDPRETLRIGITVLFSMQLMHRLASFMAKHKNVELTLIQNGSRELQRQLAAGELDLGVLSFPKIERSISIDPLPDPYGSYSVSVVMRNDNPLSNSKTLTFSDLKDQVFCTLPNSFVLGDMLVKRCLAAGFTPKYVFTNDDWEVLLSNVRATGSICLLPSAFSRLSAYRDISWIPLDDKANSFSIGIATRQNTPLTPTMGAFIKIIKQT
ncbi:MAG: LysR family transcriptional regulator [Propionibacteriaceae bacterium]